MASIKKSSFQKRGAVKSNIIKGTKPSLHNSQLLISSGIPSFDALIGGGLPVGSLILLNEDEYGSYAKFFLKYFLAEGIVSNHSCFLGSQDTVPEDVIKSLPAPVDTELDDEKESENRDRKMTIAWRYENLKTPASSFHGHSHFGHYFDLSKTISEEVIKKSDIELWSSDSGESGENFEKTGYWSLLNSIEKKLKSGKYFAKDQTTERNVLRVAIHRLGSPFWQYDNQSNQNETYLYMFLYRMRALLRNAYATCLITLPFSNYKKANADKCIHLCDIAFQLQSFAGTKMENSMAYKDYHGFFIIQKLAAINSLVAFNPGVTNLAFKLRRRKIVIEEFHLPPELEDSAEREQDDSAVLTCSSIKTNKYDF
ncbi:hypothetical protein RUM44_007966 [Polyplax serrata]|uniref:Elongator complex protein 4 n=1 Tax=Polyplax serrata TaxID=468196 RepID=A0ABR1BB02_POLSC